MLNLLHVRLRIWLEELKYLFLRMQNLSQAVFNHLVTTVLPSSKLADEDFQQLLKKSKLMFNKFYHTFNKDLKILAKGYINNYSNEDTNYLDESTLNTYINHDVSTKILQKYLSNTRELELADKTQETNCEFISYKQVLEDIKNMDQITISLDIPTQVL
ncbi:36110_t:CDS:2 [Racocetra persica]|uniref:36110_t:CDS:1 n=1 Tax=Racocetra persica TaxID=160502 RepID=A0ACA9KR51_9GLOM|nr:36110_t:CDS:2 [Racocetra persica]